MLGFTVSDHGIMLVAENVVCVLVDDPSAQVAVGLDLLGFGRCDDGFDLGDAAWSVTGSASA